MINKPRNRPLCRYNGKSVTDEGNKQFNGRGKIMGITEQQQERQCNGVCRINTIFVGANNPEYHRYEYCIKNCGIHTECTEYETHKRAAQREARGIYNTIVQNSINAQIAQGKHF